MIRKAEKQILKPSGAALDDLTCKVLDSLVGAVERATLHCFCPHALAKREGMVNSHPWTVYGELNPVLNTLQELSDLAWIRSQNTRRSEIDRAKDEASRSAYVYCQHLLINLDKYSRRNNHE